MYAASHIVESSAAHLFRRSAIDIPCHRTEPVSHRSGQRLEAISGACGLSEHCDAVQPYQEDAWPRDEIRAARRQLFGSRQTCRSENMDRRSENMDRLS